MTLKKIENNLLKLVTKLENKHTKLVAKQFEIENNFDDYEEKTSYKNNIDKQFEVADELEEAKEELRVVTSPKNHRDLEDGKEIIKCESDFDDDIIKEYEIKAISLIAMNKELTGELFKEPSDEDRTKTMQELKKSNDLDYN